MFCCQDGSLPPTAELATSEIKGRVDGKSPGDHCSFLLPGWDLMRHFNGNTQAPWQLCGCGLQCLLHRVSCCQGLPQCHGLVSIGTITLHAIVIKNNYPTRKCA